MLSSLYIKDYALIESINIEFYAGLNIITGETGAGKSILIDAMGLLLGERASTEIVRKGAAKSIVEGVFEIEGNKKVIELLELNNIDFMPEMIVRREISLKGANRCFVNDTPVPLNIIREIGYLLVDLHGQHEHQSLLRTDTHIELVDEFGETLETLKEFTDAKKDLTNLLKELNDLKDKESLLSEKKSIYEFQIKEIDEVAPQENEDDQLVQELKILENSEKLVELSTSIYDQMYDSENSVYDNLVEIRKRISELCDIDSSVADKKGECESAVAIVNEISEYMRSYKDKIDLDPAKVDEVRDRLGELILLKKKYGPSLQNVLEHREKIGKEYDLAENFGYRIKELETEVEKLRKKCGEIAQILTQKRKNIAETIKSEIENALSQLGIVESNFVVKIENTAAPDNSDNFIIAKKKKYKFNSRGIDEIEFFISTNIGEDPKSLAKVASGGEISRIMLALKSILAKNDKLPLLIFDEIDTGVSGRIAQKVGGSLKSLSQFHQIISITHLPQIAGFADHHYVVEKKNVEDRAITSIHKLDDEARVREVAKLMSGEEVTDASLKGARELIQKNN
ncbi:DNA repair protein RecN [Bacteroidota bacterium]